jgi:uncharacterized protein YdiU (UPF0061 family)
VISGPNFDNSYRRLPERFFAAIAPTPVAAPRLIVLNEPLAAELGFDALPADELVEAFAGNRPPPGAEPLSAAYAGHQFGNFVPQLGDGRACLLGEVVDRAGRRRDIVLKGSGPTPFSRGGDGRAALGPVLREYLVSEAMHALGVPTTRALAAVMTGEPVHRVTALPGAIVVRVAASHIRVGTFEYFAARRDHEAVKVLADHVRARHYPELADGSYLELLEAVVERHARLVAHWMRLGFIHGVMNTDNTTLSGETIDYGPCAFMDGYDPNAVFSSIDRAGRYAFANQPTMAQWNLARLAECLLPLIDTDVDTAVARATSVLEGFATSFQQQWRDALLAKLGIVTAQAGDDELAGELVGAMSETRADFTATFRRLVELAAGEGELADVFGSADAANAWLARWQARLADEGAPQANAARMRALNPAVVPRNHLVERVIRAAEDAGDFEPFHVLRAALERPFDEPADPTLVQPPLPHERVTRTFCGT